MRTAYRASVLHCIADPGEPDAAHAGEGIEAVEAIEDGLLIVEEGRIVQLGEWSDLAASLPPEVRVHDYSGKLILPGLIDAHVHYPQLDIIGSHGARLLEWLERYAFPCEMKFADASYARAVARRFVDELIRNGTTTALVFGTVHEHSADAVFEAAAHRDLRLIAGKVLMDSHCPEALRDDPRSGYEQSQRLIERWHGRGRLGYAVTPRFALTSSEAQLEAAGQLASEHPDVWVHTHLAETRDEVDLVAERFPWSASYLDVYDHFGLLRERSVFAHCVHLSARDCRRMAARGGAAVHCPSSNLFLGSGLFDLRRLREQGVRVGLGSDVGGGTSLSLLDTLSDAYKVLRIQQQVLSPARALYLATLGGADALGLANTIGNFVPGKEADFIVLDPRATPLTAHRSERAQSLHELLFALIILGDDRNVTATYLRGQRADPETFAGEDGAV